LARDLTATGNIFVLINDDIHSNDKFDRVLNDLHTSIVITYKLLLYKMMQGDIYRWAVRLSNCYYYKF
jgi:hypothetical protein